MKNNITLDVNHSDKRRMEYFLNAVDQKLKPVSFDWQALKLVEDIIGGYRFKGDNNALTITVLFTSSYFQANEIAKVNSFPMLANAKWGVNGSLLYLVESNEADEVSDILSLFAGKE